MTQKFKPLSHEDLRLRYGSFYDSCKKQVLNKAKVPAILLDLIPYAEIWGITDDLEREHLVIDAPEVAKQDLQEIIDSWNNEFDEWLAGPEADSEEPTPEYLAFSAMRMARDFL